MPGNLTILVMINSIMGMTLDHNDYIITGPCIQDCIVIFKQYKALKRCNQTGCVSNRTKTNHLTRSDIYKTVSMMGLETNVTTYDPFLNN